MSEVKNRQSFSIKDLPCENVVVYMDRAEVTRLVKVKLEKGENEIVLSDVSNNIDEDSVRVEGKGEASVLDVVCNNKAVKENEASSNENVKQLQAEIKELEGKIEKVKQIKERLTRQVNVLNDFADTLSKPGNVSNGEKKVVLNSSKESVDSFFQFLNLFSDRMENYDDSFLNIQNELSSLEDQLNVAKHNLKKISYLVRNVTK